MTDRQQRGACLRAISEESWVTRVLGRPRALLVLGLAEVALTIFRIVRLIATMLYVANVISCRALALTLMTTRLTGVLMYTAFTPNGCRKPLTKRRWALATADAALAVLYVGGFVDCQRYTLLAGVGMEMLHLACGHSQRW
jgi:hypothetical protein